MPRIQATGSIEVRGEGSALGQRQGVAMWQRSHSGEALLFNRLLEKLGKGVARFTPFPPLQASLEVCSSLRAAIKTAEFNVRTSPGVYEVRRHSFGHFTPQEGGPLHACQVLRQVLVSDRGWGYEADTLFDLSIIALCCLLPQEGSVVVLL